MIMQRHQGQPMQKKLLLCSKQPACFCTCLVFTVLCHWQYTRSFQGHGKFVFVAKKTLRKRNVSVPVCVCVHTQVWWSIHDYILERGVCIQNCACAEQNVILPVTHSLQLAQFPRTKESFRRECFLDNHTTVCLLCPVLGTVCNPAFSMFCYWIRDRKAYVSQSGNL